jgi:hypothetical protein
MVGTPMKTEMGSRSRCSAVRSSGKWCNQQGQWWQVAMWCIKGASVASGAVSRGS